MSVATGSNDSAYQAPISSSDEIIYRSVSRAAVGSLILAGLGLMAFLSVGLIVLAVIGLLLGMMALISIRKYPDELLGKNMALTGLVISLATLAIAPIYHAYIYATEVPPGYERVNFATLTSPKNAPDLPPPVAMELDGKKIFVKGYIHPSSMDSARSKKFVLVPDLGTCCFGGQPPLTHMIEVTLGGDAIAKKGYRKQKLAGTLRVNMQLKPIEGLQGVYYTLQADHIN